MDRSEYLRICMEQVRCRRMRPVLREELEAHMEDQKAAYMASGKTEQEAEQKAVLQMGDPVETGAALDRVHRPRMDWRTAAVILAISAAGLLLYWFLYQDGIVTGSSWRNYAGSTFLGIGAMFGMCFADYTALGKYPRAVWLILTGAAAAAAVLAAPVNGMVRVGWMVPLLLPGFAGIVFYYRNQRYWGIAKALAWLALSGALLWALGALDMGWSRCLFFAGCLGMLLFAVGKGWYRVPRFCAPALGAALLFGYGGLQLYSYCQGGFRMRRIEAWLHPERDPQGISYVQQQLAAIRRQAVWVGEGGAGDTALLQGMEESYLFTGLLQKCGILAGCLAALALFWFAAVVFKRLWEQKNRLGAVAGFGCLLALLIPFSLHLFVNLGWAPVTSSWMPFFSGGGKTGVTFYLLMGLLLSVFRRQSCSPEPVSGGAGMKLRER